MQAPSSCTIIHDNNLSQGQALIPGARRGDARLELSKLIRSQKQQKF